MDNSKPATPNSPADGPTPGAAQPLFLRRSRSSRAAISWVVVPFIAFFALFSYGVLNSISADFRPGYAHYKQGNYTAAEADFRKMTQGWDSNENIGHYYLGLCLLHEGRMEEARPEIQFAVDHPGGGKSSKGNSYYYKAVKLLEDMKELPADPTTAQREQWLAKHPKLIYPK